MSRYIELHALPREWKPDDSIKDAYIFKPTGKLQWLQQKLYTWLMKRGSLQHWQPSYAVYKKIVIDHDKVSKKLIAAYRGIFDYYGRDAKRVYMGFEDYESLMGESMEDLRHVGFDFNMRYNYNDREMTVMNLPVHVVPHMKGVLIV